LAGGREEKERKRGLNKVGFKKVGHLKFLPFFKFSSSSTPFLLQLLLLFNLTWSSWTLVVGVDYIVVVKSFFVYLQTLIVGSRIVETWLTCWKSSSSSNPSYWKFVKPCASSNSS